MEKFEQPKPLEQRPDDSLGGGNTEQTENMEGGLSFEWGKEFGKTSWKDVQEKIVELNKTLKAGEKPWRLPTTREWGEVLKPLDHVKTEYEAGAHYGDGEQGESSISRKTHEERGRVIDKILKNNNLKEGEYWSCMDKDDIEQKEEEIQKAANAQMPSNLETLLEKIQWEEENFPTDYLSGPFIFSTGGFILPASEGEDSILRVVR